VGWRFPENQSIEMARKAVDSCFWPLFEVEYGEWKLNYNPEKAGKKIPIEEWIKPQGRFRHLFAPENRHIIDELQAWVDKNWARLKKLAGVE
ncbi:pyruvate ferredoxin oxidoreductase, partial [bacterium]|nr:pyruvate ferredoxin oxidoreductase [bacterium]